MSPTEAIYDSRVGDYAPGTVLLEEKLGTSTNIVRHPVPTSDCNDPLNWSKLRKGVNFGLSCSFVLWTFVVLDNTYVAYSPYETDLGATYGDLNETIASNYAGLAVGSLFILPFVHRFGRRPIYILSSVIQFAMCIWCAKMNSYKELIPTSLIAGLGGSVSETIAVITIGDLFFVHQHALMNGIFLLMQSTGAFLGPVIMGFVVTDLSWRFMWWLTTIFVGANLVLVLFFFEESKYIPEINGQSFQDHTEMDAHQDLKEDANPGTINRTATDTEITGRPKSYRQRLALWTFTPAPIIQHLYQPFILFFTIPAVAYTSLTYGSMLAWYAVMSSAQSYYTLLPPYNLSPSSVGLLSLAGFVGLFIGSCLFSPLSDWSVLWLSKRNKGVFEPEMRLWLALPGALLCFIGLLTFGLCLSHERPLIGINVASAIYSVGFIICADVSLTYLLDAYHGIVGDAMVAVVFFRNALAVVILFVYTPWITNMGIQNAFLIVAFIGLFLLLIPVVLLIWGKKFRIKSVARYQYYSQRQTKSRAE